MDVKKISLKEKIGYGFGDAASSMFWKIFGMYSLFFYGILSLMSLSELLATVLKVVMGNTVRTYCGLLYRLRLWVPLHSLLRTLVKRQNWFMHTSLIH